MIALGNPFGVPGAAAVGIIHALGRVEGFERLPWIQADIRLAPGNSGGPLANARGEVVGINSMINRGLGMAIPSEAIEQFLRAAHS